MTLKNEISGLSEKAKAFSVESLMQIREQEESRGKGEAVREGSAAGDKAKRKSANKVKTCRSITMELCSSDLWEKFSRIGTEMIVTKAGRRMFPTLKVRFHGLSMSAIYIVYMDIVPVGETRYRYIYHSSQWMAAGTSDVNSGNNVYIHPDSPATGQLWISQGHISFDKIKLTNNRKPIMTGQISLHSMHKYQPRIHILEVPISDNLRLNSTSEILDYIKANRGRTATFSFSETVFITVTAYQNQEITKLKIQSNPFAKGFRDSSKARERTNKAQIRESYQPQPPPSKSCQHAHLVPAPHWRSEPWDASSWGRKAQKIPLKFVIPPIEMRETEKWRSKEKNEFFYRNYR